MSNELTVVFICEHGAAKSVIAAAYLEHLAAIEGVKVTAAAGGTDPEPAMSAVALAGLASDGLPVPNHEPRHADPDELARATAIVSFGPALDDLAPADVARHLWADIPAVTDGFAPARDAIIDRLRALLQDLTG